MEFILSVSYPWGECIAFSAAETIQTGPIAVPPGIHYCWVDRVCGFKAWIKTITRDQRCWHQTQDSLISGSMPTTKLRALTWFQLAMKLAIWNCVMIGMSHIWWRMEYWAMSCQKFGFAIYVDIQLCLKVKPTQYSAFKRFDIALKRIT